MADTETKKVQKFDFDFANCFAFLAPPARCGSNEYRVHRSEVDINRVLTQNVSAVFKEELTLQRSTRASPPSLKTRPRGDVMDTLLVERYGI